MSDKTKVDPELYAPGMWKCHTCGFTQHCNIINPAGIFASIKVYTEPCPNDGDVMFPVTWKELSEENQAFGIKLLDERTATVERLLKIEKLGGDAERLAREAIDAIYPGANFGKDEPGTGQVNFACAE